MKIIMFIDRICLYLNVLSFLMCNPIQASDPDGEFTLDQYEGQWYDIGRISTCEDIDVKSCTLYDVDRYGTSKQSFFQSPVPIVSMANCEYGFPVYDYFNYGILINSRIIVRGDELKPPIKATIKSYNNGKEIILADTKTQSCSTPSYRLWSKNREVSSKTKTTFEKLARNGTAKYYAWELCPKLRNEKDKEFTLEQFEGVWYDIASIYYGDLDMDRCTTNEIRGDHQQQTFNYNCHAIRNRYSVHMIQRGNIRKSVINFLPPDKNDKDTNTVSITPVSCNNGTDLVVRVDKIPNYGILSRNLEISNELMADFARFSEHFEDAHFTVYPQNNCPNRKN